MVKQIAVISGKGGTGKTSIVGSLAFFADNNVLVDCDVDAADLHLIIQGNNKSSSDFIGGKIAEIFPDKCTDCGLCVEYCRFDAIKMKNASLAINDDAQHIIEEYSCEGCGVCVEFCPEDAIILKDVISGKWFFTETKYGPLFHAKLGIAESNSGKLVSLLRSKALELSKNEDYKYIIIDGPPGIGCPVIASLTGVDYTLIITEPTKSAIHDMERLMELTKHFKIKTGICINKYDINKSLSDRIRDIADKSNIQVLGSIPYDTTVTKAQIEGIPYPEFANNDMTKHLQKLWENVKKELKAIDDDINKELKTKQFNV